MDYIIKNKKVNGNILFGIIDKNLKEVLPFEYSNIEEIEYEYYDVYKNKTRREKYYILSNQDNKKGIFTRGEVVLEPSYDDADLIPNGDNWITFIVGRQTEQVMQYGILQRQLEGWDGFKHVMVYPFGKADEIKWKNDKIMLYKNKNNIVLKGVFNDSQLGTQDPIYTQLDFNISKPSGYPIMPDPEHVFVEKDVKWSFGFQDWDIEYVKVGKIKNRKEVKGILTKTSNYDSFSRSSKQNIWNEFVPCEYSDCEIDTKSNLIKLSKIKNGKQLKGLMGYSTYWNIYTKGSVVEGYCSFKPEFTIPCEYDYIRLLYDATESYEREKNQYYIVAKDGKVGLIKVGFSTVRGPYDNHRSNYRFDFNTPAKIAILLDCEYDNISRLSNGDFVMTVDGKKGLLIDGMRNKDGNLLKTNCEYKSVEDISNDKYENLFIITDFDDKKSVITTHKQQSDYEFKSIVFGYDSISDKGLIKCTKSSNKGFKHDIYNHSLDLILSDVDSEEYKYNMHKFVTKIDETNIRIIFIDYNGDVLFDEQGNNISASYCKSLRTFIISNNGILQIRNSKKDRGHNNTKTDIQGDYLTFSFVDGSKQIKYRKKSDTMDSKYGLYKFECSGWDGEVTVQPVLKDEYESIETVSNGTRSIVSKLVGDDQMLKYGVMENNCGNECIPIEHDSIVSKKAKDGKVVFVVTNIVGGVPQDSVFDNYGFLIENKTNCDKPKTLGLAN